MYYVKALSQKVDFLRWILFSFTFNLLVYKMTSWTEDLHFGCLFVGLLVPWLLRPL